MIKSSVEDIQELFVTLGVSEGDTVMLHTALFTLGIIERGVEGFYSAIRSILGPEGTLIVPTFTYSFRRNQEFDIVNTVVPKGLGAFPEYLRCRNDVVRSADPVFSMVAEGPKASYLMRRESTSCFGNESIYEKIFKENTLIITMGISYSTGLAAFMHIEKLAQVDYRHDLELEGISIGYDGNRYKDRAIHYARDEKCYPKGRTNREPIGLAMEKVGIASNLIYGSGKHIALNALEFEDFVLNELSKNKHVMFTSG